MTSKTFWLQNFKLKINKSGVALTTICILMSAKQGETCFFVKSLYVSNQPALRGVALRAVIAKRAAMYILVAGKAVSFCFIKNKFIMTLPAVNACMLSCQRKISFPVIKLHWL